MTWVPPRFFFRQSDVQLSGLSFCAYSAAELRALSVLRVSEARTFDELGYPMADGLYDARLGASDTYAWCKSCGMQGVECPGHMGHVELPMPVFNPVHSQLTYQILKGSCVKCHRMMCPTVPSKVFLAQLQLLDGGHTALAVELGSRFASGDAQLSGGQSFGQQMLALDDVDKLVERSMTDRAFMARVQCVDGATAPAGSSRNVVDLRTRLVKDYGRDFLFKRRARCPHCKHRQPTIREDGIGVAFVLDYTAAQSGGKGSKQQLKNIRLVKDEANSEANDEAAGNGPTLDIADQITAVAAGAADKLSWRANEVREHLRLLWTSDASLLGSAFPLFRGDASVTRLVKVEAGVDVPSPVDVLFLSVLPVPPSKFRPIRFMHGQKFDHPQSASFKRVLENCDMLQVIVTLMRGGRSDKDTKRMEDLVAQRVMGKDLQSKLYNAYGQVQMQVNALFDMELDKYRRAGEQIPGIKQLIEKKQGLFRMHMMGKRVNYAARSVITPDPFMAIDEVGIPDIFARKLTFCEFVNNHNVPLLRKLVRNGALVHPGANYVLNEVGVRSTLSTDRRQRLAVAKRLHAADADVLRGGPKAVLRQMREGDIVLMNRQPTLHKPSIMAHRVRILRKQKTLRLNYATCKAYNADFDGDEMNVHFPQCNLARAESFEIANVNYQYLVPKDGTPILGLIQDHVVSGVLLTLRDRFFNRQDYNYLVLSAFAKPPRRIKFLPPTILRPVARWTGKQVISTLIANILPPERAAVSLARKAKTPVACWQVAGYPKPDERLSDSWVEVRRGQLLQGVLDKAAYGATAFGLIHCCYELYGPHVSAQLLSSFSRVFTTFLQSHGFSLGVGDLGVLAGADKQRRRSVRRLRKCGVDAVRAAFALGDADVSPADVEDALMSAYWSPDGGAADVKQLDYCMKTTTDTYADDINKACIPYGLEKSFPQNSLQLMIQAGAKGTPVNAMQISCLLGQIELEGSRPAVGASGRTLPVFRPFDASPRAGGFVDGRFMTGISPPELFFHTMAGREGLIDTAVKTSRSGYLQRCIIKHLEGIVVAYDGTARDYDSSLIQFHYGEDGMEAGKTAFLNKKQFGFLSNNFDAAQHAVATSSKILPSSHAERQHKKVRRWLSKKLGADGDKAYTSPFLAFARDRPDLAVSRDRLIAKWRKLAPEKREEYEKANAARCPEPVFSRLNPYCYLGSLSETVLADLDDHVGTRSSDFRELVYWKALRARTQPGECVGLLAAQSIGEPSTQMTLNTFHFAGRGEMNVTLGIPRLREVLMTGSRNIATPTARVAFRANVSRDQAEFIRCRLDRIALKSALKKITVVESFSNTQNGLRAQQFKLTVALLRPAERDDGARHLSREQVLAFVERVVVRKLCQTLQRRHEERANHRELEHRKVMRAMEFVESQKRAAGRDDDEAAAASSDEEGGGADADAADSRLTRRHDDAAEYEGEEEEERVVPSPPLEDVRSPSSPSSPRRRCRRRSQDLSSAEEDEGGAEDEGAVKTDGGAPTLPSAEKRQMSTQRVQAVLRCSALITDYSYDANNAKWAKLVILMPAGKNKVDVRSVVTSTIDSSWVQSVEGIEKCLLQEDNGQLILATQGINLHAFYEHSDKLDIRRTFTNCIHTVADSFGIEAAAKAIVMEVINVFGCYGIEVDRRHLTLAADYLTHTGRCMPFNRAYMESASSPLQKMTFETTTAFLRQAMLHGQTDRLESPSAGLVVGQPMRGGTGAFELVMPWRDLLGADH